MAEFARTLAKLSVADANELASWSRLVPTISVRATSRKVLKLRSDMERETPHGIIGWQPAR